MTVLPNKPTGDITVGLHRVAVKGLVQQHILSPRPGFVLSVSIGWLVGCLVCLSAGLSVKLGWWMWVLNLLSLRQVKQSGVVLKCSVIQGY